MKMTFTIDQFRSIEGQICVKYSAKTNTKLRIDESVFNKPKALKIR